MSAARKQAPRVVEGHIDIWLNEYAASYVGPQELADKDGDWLAKHVHYAGHDMTTHGWTRIGSARVELTIDPADQILASRVEALRAEKTQVLAKAQNRATEIDREIQTLLAITFDGSPA